ncbi:TonB-dependent receptor [Mucilaginibacter sp. ZT4R22]|uniref:TonB-dependent receptor n=1 Tax=Mucilaginibacter pankratovii TaxID=2772110 RepID=A0ABR7WNE5_9SPHI|nr:outer membrane beta-barrel family protein [Mucilaginibacter pankratovii]MBD1363848.1 TonB-dependent receptor [Mucilaginibacter pankratovii]
MRLFLLAAIACLCCKLSFGQSTTTITVQGVVIDSAANKPLGYTTIALTDAVTNAPVKSTLSKDDGTFSFSSLPAKAYKLSLISMGYRTKIIDIKGDANADLGKLLIAPGSKQLKEVAITAARPLMKQEVDRISYDVLADPESKAISALDMMRKVPMLSVDADDKIQLKGSGNYKILINGKESALMAKSPSDVLKAMPATNIEKIEVITTPPAKYDAEGLAGIINIITKKNGDQGYNGSLNSRINSVFGPAINLNGTMKQGKFGLSLFGGIGSNGHNTNPFSTTQTQFAQNTTISQIGDNTFGGHFKYANAELSYEIDSLNLITGSYQLFQGDFDQNSSQLSAQTNGAGVLTQGYNLLSTGVNNDKGMDLSLNYQLGFKKHKDELLTLSYKYSYGPGKNTADNMFSNRFNYPETFQPNYRQYNEAGNREHTFQLDYAYPVKKVSIEAGAKAILRNNFSDFRREDFDPLTSAYVINEAQTNIFNYHQDVYSFYNSYQLKFTKFTAKFGARLERTQVNADFSGTPLDKGYSNLIPSISVQRSFSKSSVSLGFTQRIQRPGIYQLNPFIDRSNPKFINTGNPDLKPELNNTFEFTYSNFSKGSINASLSYAFSNNSIQNVTSINIENAGTTNPDTVTTTTYQNLGSNRTLGLNLNSNYALTKKISFSLNARISHVWLKGTYNGQFYKNDGFTGNVFTNLGYKFAEGYRFGIDAGYFSSNVLLQGKNGSGIFSSYVLGKEFFKKALTISAVANNPYAKFRTFRSYTNTPDFEQSSLFSNRYRSLAIRINYKFGKLNANIKKNQRGINNDDTQGKSAPSN